MKKRTQPKFKTFFSIIFLTSLPVIFPLIPPLTLFPSLLPSAYSDCLTTHTKNYQDVIVVEGENLYYILNSVDGSIESISKEDVLNVIIDQEEKRTTLRNEWKRKRPIITNTFYTFPYSDASKTENFPPENKTLKKQSESTKERREELTLKVEHLDNFKQNSIINSIIRANFPSTNSQNNPPEKPLPGSKEIIVAHNNPQYSGFGAYPYGGSSALPKVVLRYPPASGPTGGYGIPGVEPPGLGYPGRGLAPTYGGRAYPIQGTYYSGYRDVTIISNISDLFSTIDDRLVGEFPYSFYYIKPSQQK